VITAVMALQSKTEPANTKADSLDTQLNALQKDHDAETAAKDALDAAAKDSGKVKTEMARINRSVTQLFGQISGSPFLPTTTQRDQLADLQQEFARQDAALDTLLKKTVPAIEKRLNEAGVPRISVNREFR
jgi:cytosine/adenosine deaminase-related metal-dependent hydrolase